jgi:leader peptidase (prepilin peptidase) / N-methyltransferase
MAIEMAALGVAGCAAIFGDYVEIWWSGLFGWGLLTLAWIDARTMLLPDVLTLPLLLTGLVATWVEFPDDVADHALAAATGYLTIAAIGWIYRRVRRRDGLGMGDAKLLAAIGAWVGFAMLPLTLLLAACSCLVVAGAAAVAGRHVRADTALPFGPFLALSGWIVWLHAQWIADGGWQSWAG